MNATIEETLKRNVGCSDLGAICGVDPYRNAGDVFDRLMGLATVEQTPQMERGHMMEDTIARKYSIETGRAVQKHGVKFVHPALPFLVGHIDRRQLLDQKHPGVLEIKSRNSHMIRKIKREGLDGSTLLQIQGYLLLTGYDVSTFATVDYDSWQLLYFDLEPDREIQTMIEAKVADFWNNKVLQNIRPEIYQEPVELNLPLAAQGEVVTMDDPDWFQAVQDLKEAKRLAEDAKMIEDAAKAKIQEIMTKHGASVAEGAGARIYWKEQNGRRTFDVKAFARAHPELDLEAFYRLGKPIRAFRPYFLE